MAFSYSRVVTVAAMQAVSSSAWIAARELPPARRRLARAGIIAVGAAGYAAMPDNRRTIRELRSEVESLRDKDEEAGDEPESRPDEPEAPESPFDKRRAIATAGALGLTIAVTLGRRRLQKRWLARLVRDGHAHPNRALALRMAPMMFAAEIAVQLIDRQLKPDRKD